MNLKNILSSAVSDEHRNALAWFQDHAGEDVPWPKPLNGLFLANKAKGIHKPKSLSYALSVRKSLNGPYEDSVVWSADGSWTLIYHHEGSDPELFTNQAMSKCLKDGVPIGVLVQSKAKPDPRYRVLGLGLVAKDNGGLFTIQQFGSALHRAESIAVHLPPNAFDASDVTDARERQLRAIALRKGQPKFRKSLIEAYQGRCAISGCDTLAVLEAAHVLPYLGEHTNHVTNGILLRTDLHTLFDLGLILVDPESYRVVVHADLNATDYACFADKTLHLPSDQSHWPDRRALATRTSIDTPYRETKENV